MYQKNTFIILGGTTFHRGLHFQFGPEYLPLDPESLSNLRQQFENMMLVIIGEKHAFKFELIIIKILTF